jgi:hypothetical protein
VAQIEKRFANHGDDWGFVVGNVAKPCATGR